MTTTNSEQVFWHEPSEKTIAVWHFAGELHTAVFNCSCVPQSPERPVDEPPPEVKRFCLPLIF